MRLRDRVQGADLRRDGVAGLVLGVESVPDGLAGGLLAGVNPVYGLHGYMVGTFAGALATSSAFMAVQATGAMAMIVADVPAVHGGADPDRALFTLAVLTGLVMLLAGVARLGFVLRYVANTVMVGFISAVGINIVLGQLDGLTGYTAEGPGRIGRAMDTIVHVSSWDVPTISLGLVTVVLIVLLERTPLGSLGMVLAITLTSGAAAVLDLPVATLSDLAEVPSALPTPVLPDVSLVPALIVPALSLAFVGLVQGAGISASFQNPDGSYPDASRDFIGQGAANVAAGLLRGMPVGGSMSATALVAGAGARSRLANLTAGAVMAVVVVALGPAVEATAMAALAGLLIVVGIRTVKAPAIVSVWKTGAVQAAVMTTTLVLTLLIPLQYAVLLGVGASVLLYVVDHSNRFTVRRRELSADGMREVDPPAVLPGGEVVVLQPYGSLFFASAAALDDALPDVAPTSSGSVVVLRLRGVGDIGSTVAQTLGRYATALTAVGSKLVVVSAGDRVIAQLHAAGATDTIDPQDLYPADEWVGTTLRRAHTDALAWVTERAGDGTSHNDNGDPAVDNDP